ncbi:MAG: hypothetical protein GF404_07185 [candidate division Zixibacteria bacterium]|nr:hypothetical protein [candidate division Zixibacteria bacterium]
MRRGLKMKVIKLALIIFLFLASCAWSDEISDKVDDLFMKASSGEVQFRDLVEPSKEELIEMGEQAVGQLITKLATEDARERHTLEAIFKGIGEPAVPYLIGALQTENLYQLRLASICLGKIGHSDGTEPVMELFDHYNHTVRSSAATAVGNIGDTIAVEALIVLLSDSTETVRKSASVALGKIGHPNAIDPLIATLSDPHYSVRYSAEGSLVKIGEESGDNLLERTEYLDKLALYHTVAVWQKLKYSPARKTLEKYLKSPDNYLRGFSLLALAEIDSGRAKKHIRKIQDKENDLFVLSCMKKAGEIISKDDE